jgi:hypothetical protein
MPIDPLDLPELLRNLPTEMLKNVNNLYNISDVIEQVVPVSSVRRGSYAFPWPDEVKGLGRRRVDAFDRCARCSAGSWVRYGTTVLCVTCAKRNL